ncbi:MAG: hypothetical protein CMM93_02365 [Rickettsiales bacterium]|nr:hypothetical protein [Rickettsiales bacterium]
MEWGAKIKDLEAVMAMGVMPKALSERPTLLPGLDIYLTAYRELKSDRPIGMAIGLIPWSSIHRWAIFHGLTLPDDVAVLEHHIRALESEERVFEKKGKP